MLNNQPKVSLCLPLVSRREPLSAGDATLSYTRQERNKVNLVPLAAIVSSLPRTRFPVGRARFCLCIDYFFTVVLPAAFHVYRGLTDRRLRNEQMDPAHRVGGAHDLGDSGRTEPPNELELDCPGGDCHGLPFISSYLLATRLALAFGWVSNTHYLRHGLITVLIFSISMICFKKRFVRHSVIAEHSLWSLCASLPSRRYTGKRNG